MSVSVATPRHVQLGTSETEIVPQSTVTKRVFLKIVNTGAGTPTVSIWRYDSAGSETAGDDNAIIKDRGFTASSEEILEIDFWLVSGWKVTGLSDTASVITVNVDQLEV